ncbi:hypothetical protein D5H75_30965 [Bailinhaonella thermotolerans]|uniref:Uncharacterized protein n=1 Tax=Bailinhaonella thermotolerans TaxID=1070861 RepID=A0A3A4AWR6_9ACTN|nr:hypothetical protein D5H75_30965 [Bailinhaonella thermotolerans]
MALGFARESRRRARESEHRPDQVRVDVHEFWHHSYGRGLLIVVMRGELGIAVSRNQRRCRLMHAGAARRKG